jgi:hypothetical protein
MVVRFLRDLRREVGAPCVDEAWLVACAEVGLWVASFLADAVGRAAPGGAAAKGFAFAGAMETLFKGWAVDRVAGHLDRAKELYRSWGAARAWRPAACARL